jgi:hypothetical protein
MKSGPPEKFDGHYVICVSGIPLMGGSRYQGEDDDNSPASRRRDEDDMDRLRGLLQFPVGFLERNAVGERSRFGGPLYYYAGPAGGEGSLHS